MRVGIYYKTQILLKRKKKKNRTTNRVLLSYNVWATRGVNSGISFLENMPEILQFNHLYLTYRRFKVTVRFFVCFNFHEISREYKERKLSETV